MRSSNGRRFLGLAGSLGTALLVLASSATKGETQVPACGNWTLTTSTSQSRVGPGAAWDPVNHRVLRFGGYDGTNFLNDLWSYTLAGGWSQLTPAGTPPSPRDAPGFLYDPVRSRMLVVCGNAGTPPNDVWELSLSGTPTWTPIVTAGTAPTGRFAFSTIYDPIRDRVILFGGYPYTNQVWALSLAGTPTWSLLTPAGTAPSWRYGHAAIYDPVRDRMLIAAGISNGVTQSDTWQLSLSGTPTWTQLAPLGTAPQVYLTSGVYDPIRDRMLVLSGHGDQTGSIWSLSLKVQPAWFRIPAGGTAFTGRYFHNAVYEPDDDLLLGFNGIAQNGATYLTDTNRLDCAGGYWLETAADHGTVSASPQQACYASGAAVSLTAQGPTGYGFHAWLGDASGNANPLDVTMDANKVILANFTISPPGCGNWALTTTNSQSRAGPGAAWDPVNHRVLRFGGSDGTNFLNDLWSYTLADGWSQLTPTGPLPSGRNAPGFLYDPVRSRMLLICGNAGTPPNDVWQLSLTGTPTWSQVVTAGTPPTGRYAFSTIYDPIRDRVILFGGYPFTNEVWALSLAGTPTWSQLTPAGTAPSPRYGHAAIYDPVRDRMLMAAGSSSGVTPADTWQLSLSGTPTWTQLAPLGAAPPVDLTTGVYDPIRDRMLVLSGHGDQTGSIWSLSLKVQPAWIRIPAGGTAFTARYAHSAVYDPDDDLLLGFNGLLDPNGTAYLTDTNRLDCAGGYWLETAADHGTVSASPQQACYASGAAVSLTAQGQNGYTFQGWYGDASGNANPLNVAMDANKVIFAAFPGWPLNVTISPAGSGTVTKSPDQPIYLPGTQVTLTASSSFPFVGWSGDASGNTNPLTVTMDAAKNITANFQAYSLTTIVSPSGSGTVTRNPNQAAFDVGGTKVALAAQPMRGYLFGSWSGDLTGTNNPDTLLMNANKTVTANFVATPVCGGWSLVPTSSTPPPREKVTSVWDPVRHRMLVYGGSWDHGLDTHTVYSDTWSLSFAGTPDWTQVQPGGGSGARSGAIGVYDPVRDRMIIYGGYSEPYGAPAPGDVWALTLSGTPTWSQLATGGPGWRGYPSLIYDPVRDRLLLFGGNGNGNDQNDVWQLNLSGTPTWTQILPSGTPPPPRSTHGAIYDPARDRMVVFGGNAAPASGAWALSLSGSGTWTDLTPTGVPYDPTAVHSIYDPIRDRVLVFYGLGKETISALDFSNRPNQPFWCQVNSQGTSPSALVDALVYDPDDDLVLSTSLVCHRGEPGECADGTTVSYRLDLSGGLFLDTSGINGQASATQWCYDSGSTATVTANANTGYGFDVWTSDASGTDNPLTLTMDSYKVVQAWFSGRATGVEDAPVAFGLELRPNPAVGPARVEYSLPRAAKVRLSVFDIAGREVERLADGMQPPGRHTVVWGQSRGLHAGIYFVRYDTPGHSFKARLVLLR